jgi:DNA-binding response OmpR family regulator
VSSSGAQAGTDLIENPKDRGILVVDDEQDFADLVRAALVIRGYRFVVTASCGADALRALASSGSEIYVVILDIMLPDFSGLEVMERLLKSHEHPVAVLAVTGYARSEAEARFSSLRSENVFPAKFCRKPLRLSTLCSDVERLLERVHIVRRDRAGAAQAPEAAGAAK